MDSFFALSFDLSFDDDGVARSAGLDGMKYGEEEPGGGVWVRVQVKG